MVTSRDSQNFRASIVWILKDAGGLKYRPEWVYSTTPQSFLSWNAVKDFTACVNRKVVCDLHMYVYSPRHEDVCRSGSKVPYVLKLVNRRRWVVDYGFEFLQKYWYFSLLPHLDWLWGPPTLLSNVYRGYFSGSKHHSRPSRVEVEKAWSYTSTRQYVFVAWCLVKHRDNFTFTSTICNLMRLQGVMFRHTESLKLYLQWF
jgi:hypothetical protein